MTVVRPDLTRQELADARDTWTLVRNGQPVPTLFRTAASKAAAYCFARAYDHDDAAGARPLFTHPDIGGVGVPGVYGTNRSWSPTQFAAWLERAAAGVRPKGRGWMCSPGHSWRGDGKGPLPPHQQGDARCRAIGWLFLDADGGGDWRDLLDAIGLHGGAYVRGRSSNHCPGVDPCERHPGGAAKWHLAVPLREPWTPPDDLRAARTEWKHELYPAARFAFHLVGEMQGRGFDRQLEQFLCRMYAGAPVDSRHAGIPREVRAAEGLGFDARACWAGLAELGVVEPRAARSVSEPRALRRWSGDQGEPPMVAAFVTAGRYLRPLPNGSHAVVCPWESKHSVGTAGDTSTVLFADGKFWCMHSHPEGKAGGGVGMREVLAMLPPEAQATHARVRLGARAALRTSRAGSTPRVPAEVRDAVYRAALTSLQLDDAHREALRSRGLDDSSIDTNGYRTLPAGQREALIDALVRAMDGRSAESVPGASDAGEARSFDATPGLLIPVRDLEGRIVALRVRPDGAPDGSRDAYVSDRREGAAAHVPLAARAARGRRLVLVLGELAADVATALSGDPVAGLPQASSWGLALDLVAAWGVPDVAVAFGGAARSEPDIATAQVHLVDALRAAGARVSTWVWASGWKSLDEHLCAVRRGEVEP